jgi:hypothetical protein
MNLRLAWLDRNAQGAVNFSSSDLIRLPSDIVGVAEKPNVRSLLFGVHFLKAPRGSMKIARI